MTFKVQLKGTDGSGEVRTVKRDSIDYWNSLDVPVVLVSYEAKTGKLRTRWAHSLGSDRPLGTSKTVSVRMTDELTSESTTAEKLASDLQLIRRLKRGDVPTPTPLVVTTADDTTVPASSLTSQILVMSRSTAAPFRLAVPNEAAVTIRFDTKRVTATLPLDSASGSFHSPDGQLTQFPVAVLAELSILLASLMFAPVDEIRARELLGAVAVDSAWWSVEEFAERCAALLCHPSSAEQLFGVHAALLQADPEAASVYSMMLPRRVRDLQPGTFDLYVSHIGQTLESLADGQLTFTIANLCRQRNDHARALELFDQAAAQDPGYLDDPLYLRFVGASNWEIGNYSQAADCYQRALDLGFDPYELRPLSVDSLMYGGRYADARAALDDWQPRGERTDKAGVLRIVMLDYVVSVIGAENQDRAAPDDATKDAYRAAKADGTVTGDLLLQLLRDHDALDPYPLSELAAHPDNAGAFEPSLICAFMMARDAHRWAVALVVALAADAPDIVVRAIVDQARYLCDASFFEAVNEISDLLEADVAGWVRSLVEAAYGTEPEVFDHRYRLIDRGSGQRVVDEMKTPMSPGGRA